MRFFLLLFIIVPVLEMWLLITVGQLIGALPTIGLVLLTAVIGVNLLRAQGLSTLTRAQEKMSGGSLPAQEMIEGLALAVGGALLLTPGFATDAFGFACLIPPSRKFLAEKLFSKLLQNGAVFHSPDIQATDYNKEKAGSVIIDGEFESADGASQDAPKNTEHHDRT